MTTISTSMPSPRQLAAHLEAHHIAAEVFGDV
jgi:hypothetical protein